LVKGILINFQAVLKIDRQPDQKLQLSLISHIN